ncbi:MAG TPA: M12 family metallo-peptidase [Pyrinomonadaceae bacterium]
MALSKTLFTAILREAPMESSADATQKRTILTLPIADGTLSRFSIVDSPIMAPELSARYPNIKTYAAQGVDDPTTTARFDWTPAGFHGIILSPKGTVLIEPASVGDVENYIVYFQGDVAVGSGECAVEEEQESTTSRDALPRKNSPAIAAVTSGSTLRTYRLAAAATAEYTQAYGSGTVAGGLAAVTTTMNLVNAIYERELAIRLTLIANNDAIIFTDPATDGYTPDNAGALIGENQVKLDAVIGSANYDVGHVFDGRILGGGSFSWTGLAGFNAVCAGNKARGVDIFRSVSPTNLFAYYSAAHEFGHQFGATHTFNTTSGTCGGQRSSSTAYEPYNGSTIMAYRFACAPDDLRSMDTYFHTASIEQIVSFTTAGNGNTCAVQTGTGNNPPTVNAGPSYTIPMGTPFILTATGSDSDGDAITFGWEEFDLGAPAPPNTDDGSRPIFRSFAPVSSPSRTFPRLQDVLSGFETMGESLPTTTRTMNFRITARDNRSGGGGVNSAATQVNVRSDAGPFIVTSPASGASWSTGTNQTVTWNVANTNNAPVSCANVKITLSTDGGLTFPTTLLASTPNDGSEAVSIPGTPSGNARIKVEAVGNIFFNISRAFVITGSATHTLTVASVNPNNNVNISVSPTDNSGLADGTTQFTRTYNFNTTVNLTAPSNAGGTGFLKWQRDGADFTTSLTANVLMDNNHTMTAVYVAPPVIFSETGTSNVAALDSVTFVRGPFPLLNPHNFSSDQRTRIIFFTSDLGLTQPNASLSVRASGVTLPVESVGPLLGVPGLVGSYIVVRFPENLTTGPKLLTVSLGSATSNPANLTLVP